MKAKKGHTWWHRRLDKLMGEWLRESYSECAMCHGQFYLQVSHIYPKGTYQNLRYDPINLLPMCGGCHRWKWHDNPGDSWRWFEKTYPQRDTYLLEAKNVFVKRNEEYYQKVEKALKDKKIRTLLVLDNITDVI